MKQVQLDEVQNRILYDIGANRILTPEASARIHFGGTDDEAVAKAKAATKPLKGTYLKVHRLYGSLEYWSLTDVSSRLFGFPEEFAKPLGPQALVGHYAKLHFTSMRVPVFTRLTRANLKADFPECWEEFLPNAKAFHSDYYTAFTEKANWVGRMQVDHGGDYARLLVTSASIVDDIKAKPELNQMRKEGCLRLTIITGDENKRNAIMQALKAKALDIQTFVYVAPELLELVGQKIVASTAKKRVIEAQTAEVNDASRTS